MLDIWEAVADVVTQTGLLTDAQQKQHHRLQLWAMQVSRLQICGNLPMCAWTANQRTETVAWYIMPHPLLSMHVQLRWQSGRIVMIASPMC